MRNLYQEAANKNFFLGDKVWKKSRKPFKNRDQVQYITDFVINENEPKRRLAAKFSDDSICNLELLEKKIEK